MTFWILLAAATAWLLWYMVTVPGKSYSGPLKLLTADETELRENLRAYVAAVASREHNVFHFAELEAAAQYIELTLSRFGYRADTQRFKVSVGEVRNIEVEVKGAARASEIIIVGAHYDSVFGAPGANDNGSGVAATLELARLFKAQRPARTMRFVLFVNEEPPFYKTEQMGSRVYVRRAKERGENIVAMFSLETIGYYSDRPGSQRYPFPLGFFYPNAGNFIAFVSNFASRPLLHEVIAAFRRRAEFPSEGVAAPAFIPGVDWSDHWSFWEEGYPALMVTDTAPYRYLHYHAATDTPDKVDYERLARVVTGLAGMLRDLAQVQEPSAADERRQERNKIALNCLEIPRVSISVFGSLWIRFICGVLRVRLCAFDLSALIGVHRRFQIQAAGSSTTAFLRTPMPSISASITSPALSSHSGLASPPPPGEPVEMMSPGISVICDRCAISLGIDQIMSLVLPSWRVSPLTRVWMRRCIGSGIASRVTIHGPMGAKVS